ncbi:NAD-dependent epimerase/dehydratase family protein [Staphylococcus sp. HMSC69H07]|uniref:NAD-dependent epimerase/dehydratase family protein n=1 Tax=Staphylococcus sp. HMSC69H07 TaxID=1608894 RepID=UPI00210E2096|nr:NAD-dependent epimerase/dehydratase family protein [Staphylococcus sp. HMSC69H07]
MSKNILITGTGGYVGSHLANSLEKSGNKVSRLSVRNSLWENQSLQTMMSLFILLH